MVKTKSKTTKQEKFYVTTPIYYANAGPHLGSAYTTIAADILARYARLQSKKVFFLTGLDEHGQKIQETAQQNKKSPKEFVDLIAEEFKQAFKILDIQNDNFIRTTDKYHEEEVKKILQKLYDEKHIYKDFYSALYCIGCEQFKTESDLIDGKCPLHNKEPELRKEEAYLFKLSKFQDKILKAIKSNEVEIRPIETKKEMIAFIQSGLKDVSFSRLKEKVEWGIELPFDKKHTCFVWVDAFWNYISGLKTDENKKLFWPVDVQLMARDIVRVHSTIWIAMLLALKEKLPKTMFIHGYFTVNGQKMSKSLGNVISPTEIANKYGSDSLRYYLMRSIAFGSDGDVSQAAIADRHNNELANKLGNLVSRVSTLAEKYGLKEAKPLDSKKMVEKTKKYMENYEFDKALNEIFAFIDVCNEYAQNKKPWETKDEKVIWQLANGIKDATILLSPFLTKTSEKIAKTFGFDLSIESLEKPLEISKITKSEVLFTKIEFKEEKDNNINQKAQSKIQGVLNMSQIIKYDDFAKVDLRVATVKKVEDVEGADKLLKLQVEVGEEKRTILAGIKKYYKKEELLDKQVIVVFNLEPRKMKGLESQGMLLAAGGKDEDTCVLISPDKQVKSGTKIN